MARKTIRVEFSRTNPDELIKLITDVLEKNEKVNLLDAEDKDALIKILPDAKSERKQATEYEALAQSHNENAKNLLGISKQQSINTPNTGYYHISQVRNTLLKKFRGNEEKLSEWGFKVVVGKAKSPKRGGTDIPESISSPEIQ